MHIDLFRPISSSARHGPRTRDAGRFARPKLLAGRIEKRCFPITLLHCSRPATIRQTPPAHHAKACYTPAASRSRAWGLDRQQCNSYEYRSKVYTRENTEAYSSLTAENPRFRNCPISNCHTIHRCCSSQMTRARKLRIITYHLLSTIVDFLVTRHRNE